VSAKVPEVKRLPTFVTPDNFARHSEVGRAHIKTNSYSFLRSSQMHPMEP